MLRHVFKLCFIDYAQGLETSCQRAYHKYWHTSLGFIVAVLPILWNFLVVTQRNYICDKKLNFD